MTISTHHIVDLEEDTVERACEKALDIVKEDLESYMTGYSSHITSCMINDRESHGYSVYVPEIYPTDEE